MKMLLFLYLPSNPQPKLQMISFFSLILLVFHICLFCLYLLLFYYFSFSTVPPNFLIISNIIFVSCISGTLYNVVFPLFKIEAAIIGSEAFLEPDIFTIPSIFFTAFNYVFRHFVPTFHSLFCYILCFLFT